MSTWQRQWKTGSEGWKIALPEVTQQIYAKIDLELKRWPHLQNQRDEIYCEMLAYYYVNQEIPEFAIEQIRR